LVLPALLTEQGEWAGFAHPQLWAGLLALMAAWRFKNTLLTMGVGLLALFLIRLL
jgi:branched-subunit amino acid transport protein